jgi:ATP-dependent Clp protease ATP-binding subunit ClpA
VERERGRCEREREREREREAITKAVWRARTGLRNPARPIASLFFR